VRPVWLVLGGVVFGGVRYGGAVLEGLDFVSTLSGEVILAKGGPLASRR